MPGLGERLKKLRKGRNETQPALAKAMEVNPGTVSRWERDETFPHPNELASLAEHYGVKIEFLLLGSSDDEHAVDLPEFQEFLETEQGRIAQERRYIGALLSMRYPFPPTARLYRALVQVLQLEDDRQLGKKG